MPSGTSPTIPDTRTTRQLVDIVYRLAGQPTRRGCGRCRRCCADRGVFSRTVRELVEMEYLFEEPFVVDSSAIAERLGVRATPVEQALAETLESYRMQ